MIPEHRKALGISEDLVNISDRNLVHFFREELRGLAIEGIPGGPRKRFKEAGIITNSPRRGISGSAYALTPYGEALLKEDLEHTNLPTI